MISGLFPKMSIFPVTAICFPSKVERVLREIFVSGAQKIVKGSLGWRPPISRKASPEIVRNSSTRPTTVTLWPRWCLASAGEMVWALNIPQAAMSGIIKSAPPRFIASSYSDGVETSMEVIGKAEKISLRRSDVLRQRLPRKQPGRPHLFSRRDDGPAQGFFNSSIGSIPMPKLKK